MIINGKTVLFRIKNSSTFIARVNFHFLFRGTIKSHSSGHINPGYQYVGAIPEEVTDIHMYFHNDSAQGSPIFDEQVRARAIPSCFLLTGTPNYPICIPVPCSSFSCNNLCANICNFNYF